MGQSDQLAHATPNVVVNLRRGGRTPLPVHHMRQPSCTTASYHLRHGHMASHLTSRRSLMHLAGSTHLPHTCCTMPPTSSCLTLSALPTPSWLCPHIPNRSLFCFIHCVRAILATSLSSDENVASSCQPLWTFGLGLASGGFPPPAPTAHQTSPCASTACHNPVVMFPFGTFVVG